MKIWISKWVGRELFQHSSIDDRFSTLVLIPYLTFDYLPETLYNSDPYFVLCTWYVVQFDLELVLSIQVRLGRPKCLPVHCVLG